MGYTLLHSLIQSQQWSTPYLVAGLIFSYLVTLCSYRILFHPLSKFPGPFLAKITPLYHTFLIIRGNRHLVFEKYHKKYGNIFRMAPNELSVADASAIKEIYGHGKRLLKPAFYDAMNTPAHQYNIFSERDIVKNSRKRRIISSILAAKNMEQMEWVMIEKSDLFCKKLIHEIKSEGGRKSYDISRYLDFLTFDIMGILCFGKSFQMIEKAGECEVPVLDAIHAIGRSGLIFGSYPFALKFRDWLEPKKYIVDRYNFVKFSLKNLEERLTREIEGKKDFLSFLVRATDPATGSKFDKKELRAETSLLMIAGSDTLSTALTGIMYYVLKDRNVWDKLSEEILSNFNRTQDIVSAKLSSLCYLNACIEEGLRIFPPVPGGLPRTVGPDGIVIGNCVIPKNTQISTHTWTIHHDDRYYPEAHTFKPERWLERDIKREPLNPFSLGPRACIGRNMAYIEMRMILAKLVFHFDANLVNKDDPYEVEDLFIFVRSPLPIELSVRNH